MVTLTIYGDGLSSRWSGHTDHDITLMFNADDQRKIIDFVLLNANTLPVSARIETVDEEVSFQFFPVSEGGITSVGFLFRKYFIILNMEDVVPYVKNFIEHFWKDITDTAQVTFPDEEFIF